MQNFVATKRNLLGLIFALVLMVVPSTATVIDDFSTVQGAFEVTYGGTDGGEVCGAGIIGGCRDLSITAAAADGGNPIIAESSVNVSGGLLNIGNDPEITSTTTVLWDGEGSEGLTAAGAGDLSGIVSIVVLVNFADIGATIEFKIIDTDLNEATVQQSVGTTFSLVGNPPQLISTPQQYVFNIAGFDGVNLQSLKSIQMQVTGTKGFDLSVDIVEGSPVPEPSTMFLSGLALLGLAGLARRRARKA